MMNMDLKNLCLADLYAGHKYAREQYVFRAKQYDLPRSMKKQPAKPPKRDSDAWLSDARKLGNAVRTSFLRVISQCMRAGGDPCDFSDTAAQKVFDLSLQRGEVVQCGEWNGVQIYKTIKQHG